MAAKVQVFKQNEIMDDDAAMAEELGQLQEPTEQPEPESTGQPTESAPSETPADTPPQTQVERTVPFSRFQEMVTQRNAERQRAAELQERWARIDERSKQVREAQEAAQRQAEAQKHAAEQPDPQIDPAGYDLWMKERRIEALENQVRQFGQNFNQMQQGYQQDQQTTQFNNWVVAQAQDYARSTPDYFEAAQHAANWRVGFWEKLGLPNEQARQLVMAESNLLANISRQTGKPFPAIVYDLAKSVGYQGRVAAPATNGNGAIPQVTSQAASQAGKVLAQVAKGQAMQGLSRTGSAESGGKSRYAMMTPEELSRVPEAQWQKDWANPQIRAEMVQAMKKLDGFSDEEEVRYFNR